MNDEPQDWMNGTIHSVWNAAARWSESKCTEDRQALHEAYRLFREQVTETSPQSLVALDACIANCIGDHPTDGLFGAIAACTQELAAASYETAVGQYLARPRNIVDDARYLLWMVKTYVHVFTWELEFCASHPNNTADNPFEPGNECLRNMQPGLVERLILLAEKACPSEAQFWPFKAWIGAVRLQFIPLEPVLLKHGFPAVVPLSQFRVSHIEYAPHDILHGMVEASPDDIEAWSNAARVAADRLSKELRQEVMRLEDAIDSLERENARQSVAVPSTMNIGRPDVSLAPAASAAAESSSESTSKKLQRGNDNKEKPKIQLPKAQDQLDLWNALVAQQGLKADTEIADDFCDKIGESGKTVGREILNQLKTARSRGEISDWKQR